MREGKPSGSLGWPTLAGVVGATLIVLAWAADVLGLGVRRGLGAGQVLLAGLGALLVAVAVAARSEGLWRRLEPCLRWLARLYRLAAFSCFNLLLLFAGLELAGRLIDRYAVPAAEDPAPYYASQPWAQRHWRELEKAKRHTLYRPYKVWQTGPFQGETIRVDRRGVRRTPGASAAPDAYSVLAFGGSAMWGLGAPDDETIPAHLQAGFAAGSQRPVRVENFGELGFVATQSLIQLIMELQAGRTPDLVIFYHGVNDVAVARSGKATGHLQEAWIASRLERPFSTLVNASRALQLLRPLLRLTPEEPGSMDPGELQRLAGSIVRHYLGAYRMLDGLSGEYGFDYVCFWQPALALSGKPLSPKEQEIRASAPAWFGDLLHAVYGEIGRLAERRERLHSLVGVLDDVEEQLWFDPVHVTPVGNRIIAEAMLDVIQDLPDVDGSAATP